VLYITYADAVKYLREIIKEHGEDYVNQPKKVVEEEYPTCVYRDPATDLPDCGVGRVLALAGFDLSELSSDENVWAWTKVYGILRDARKVGMHYETQELLRVFQNEQDSQRTWGSALTRALDESTPPAAENDVPPTA
jgi:hypothetical protein